MDYSFASEWWGWMVSRLVSWRFNVQRYATKDYLQDQGISKEHY